MNYTMTVEIPIKEVPEGISIQEAKATGEVWLLGRIPDAKLLKFEEEHYNDKQY